MDVIELILSEEDVAELTDIHLYQFAACSYGSVRESVIAYLRNPNADPKVRERVLRAYAEQLDLLEYLQDDKTLQYVNLLNELHYSTIGYGLDVGTLQRYKDAIEYVIGSEHERYAVPYIAAIDGKTISELIQEIWEYAAENKNSKLMFFVENKLRPAKKYFRESPHEKYKGTVVKHAVRDRSKYELILRGINFLLEKKAANVSPASWRFL